MALSGSLSSYRDRTSEFHSLTDRLKKIQIPPASVPDGDGFAENARVSQPTNFVGSDFNRRASRIGVGIQETSQKIARLAKMTKKTSMFNDPTLEIEELTAVIKQDITILNAAFSDLKTLQNSEIGDDNCSKDTATHFMTIVDDLNSRLKGITKNLKDVLIIRSENLKAHDNRRQIFSSNASRGSPFTQQRATGVTGTSATNSKLPPWTNGSNLSASLPVSRTPFIDHSSNSQLRRRIGVDGTASIQMEGQMQQQVFQQQDSQMHSRATALQNVESTISELGNIFTQLATMVAQQGELAIRIDEDMDDTLANVEGAQGALLKHLNHISSNRGLLIKIFFVIIIFILIFIIFVA
uniref:t-SNARE coiled-coil homology domain-containing protein n=1 Tax=Araucaria cunninghamii TaxID=56994 RepID=A0A0D6QVD2_ARACU